VISPYRKKQTAKDGHIHICGLSTTAFPVSNAQVKYMELMKRRALLAKSIAKEVDEINQIESELRVIESDVIHGNFTKHTPTHKTDINNILPPSLQGMKHGDHTVIRDIENFNELCQENNGASFQINKITGKTGLAVVLGQDEIRNPQSIEIVGRYNTNNKLTSVKLVLGDDGDAVPGHTRSLGTVSTSAHLLITDPKNVLPSKQHYSTNR